MARVLVADDALVVRKVLSEMLEAGGHEVVGLAATGHETIRMYDHLRPDVAVIDINMPELSGLEAARAIRQNYCDARLIMASVLTTDTRLRQVGALSALYVAKPFDASQLLAAINAAWSGGWVTSQPPLEQP